MSNRPAKVDSKAVAAYLLEHPDFYESHPDILAALKISHGVDGSASLLEKQISLLRNKNEEMSDKLFELIETARAHENLSLTLHQLATGLIAIFSSETKPMPWSRKIQLIETICERILHKKLKDVRVVIHWFADFVGPSVFDVSVINAQDQRIRGLVNRLYTDRKPQCGPFSKPERVVLFPKSMTQPTSAIVAPLLQMHTEARVGLLVLLSSDPDRYVAGKGTMFLIQLMQLIEFALMPEESTDGDERAG